MLKLKVIGCSSGTPHPLLAGSSYLLMQNDRRILFDAGEGLSSALSRLQIDPLSIDTIFISHLHSDHVNGLFLYLQYVHGLRRKEPLDLFVPSEAEEAISTWLNATYLFPERLSLPIEVYPIDSDFEFEMLDLKITPHLTTHLISKKEFLADKDLPNKMQCFSFLIEASERKILYSSDLGRLEDIAPVMKDIDLLIVEALHIDIEKLPELATANGVKSIMLTHLPEFFDRTEVETQFASMGFEGLLFADEGKEIDLQGA